MKPSIKRAFDLTVASIGLLVLSPLFAVVALMINLDDRGPIFYHGMRIGRGARPFKMIKFRTMVANAERLGGSSTPQDDPRLTRVGRFLRRAKIDELPQLINVVRGDMSLVGPRPQVAWAVDLYTVKQRGLLSLRPGLTDYASIVFRREAELLRGSSDADGLYLQKIAPMKLALGLVYVEDHSLWLDLRIIFATVWAILGGRPEAVLRRLEAFQTQASTPSSRENSLV